MIELLPSMAIAFGITYIATPRLAKKLIQRGITGVDIHKPSRAVRAEMGGIAVIFGFVIATASASLLGISFTIPIWGAVITVLLVAAIGALDDQLAIRQRHKVLLTILASLPLILTFNGAPSVWFPFLGSLDLGLLYPLLWIPLLITTLSNLTNMHAGFNGLEAGIASISLACLGIASLIIGAYPVSVIALVMCSAYASFLVYNWFPAKIFPGDVGTLMSGAAVAAIGILAKLEFVAILVSIPAAFDFTLKMLSRRPFAQRVIYGDSTITDQGFLKPAPYPSLSHAFMKVANLRENQLVKGLLFMEFLYAIIALSLVVLTKEGFLHGQ